MTEQEKEHLQIVLNTSKEYMIEAERLREVNRLLILRIDSLVRENDELLEALKNIMSASVRIHDLIDGDFDIHNIIKAKVIIAKAESNKIPPVRSPQPKNPANANGESWEESEKPCPDCGQLLWTALWWDGEIESGGAAIGTLEECGNCGHYETF